MRRRSVSLAFLRIKGPWRAVPVLGTTQILGWGTIFYPVALTTPMIAAQYGWSETFAMAGFSIGIFVQGLASRMVGGLIDRYGGHRVMPVGSLMGAVGLLALAYASTAPFYFITWAFLGVAMAASLHDSAVATIGRVFGAAARRPITLLAIIGGFASTVSWLATDELLRLVGLQKTYLIYAAVLAFMAAPLHRWALPRNRANDEPHPAPKAEGAPIRILPATRMTFFLVASGFAAWIVIPAGLFPHLINIFERLGLEARMAVTISALIGPSQVIARIFELLVARDAHPLSVVRAILASLILAFALLAMLGVSIPTAAAFAIMFGIANGLILIARGTLPLALFGPLGYGRLIGRIARPVLVIQSAAPFVVAIIAERISDSAALVFVGTFAVIALACFTAVRRPAV